jgi:hypothetical protein
VPAEDHRRAAYAARHRDETRSTSLLRRVNLTLRVRDRLLDEVLAALAA